MALPLRGRLQALVSRAHIRPLLLKRFRCTASPEPTDPDPYEGYHNHVKIPLVPPAVERVLFGPRKTVPTEKEIQTIEAHLKEHKLWDVAAPAVKPWPNFELPSPLAEEGRLVGNIGTHFSRISEMFAQPYYNYAGSLANSNLPEMPKTWVKRAGWTMYTQEHPEGIPVAAPLEAELVMDTEIWRGNGERFSQFPTLAIVASPKAWYGWVSPQLTLMDENGPWPLIKMKNPAYDGARLIIGHNVSFERARIEEEYYLEPNRDRFMDTMSLHMSLHGMSSDQRSIYMWAQKKTQEVQEEIKDSRTRRNLQFLRTWSEKTAPNSLKDLYKFYCNDEVDKELVNVFLVGTLQDVDAQFNDLMTYCARDVSATHKIYKSEWRLWREKYTHKASFVGMLEMGSAFLPVTDDWKAYVDRADALYDEKVALMEDTLGAQAQALLERFELDPTDTSWYEEDPWLQHLDWSIKKGTKNIFLRGKPQWYVDVADKKTGNLKITTRQRLAPYLLSLTWNGNPIFYKKNTEEDPIFPKTKEQEYAERTRPSDQVGKKTRVLGTWGYYTFNEDGDYVFESLPHPGGQDKPVGNPLAKSFLQDIESGKLAAELPGAKELLQNAIACSYWASVKERVKNQMVYQAEGSSVKAIIPQMVTAGTVTRRAVEKTWLTASNAKSNRIGSELKSQVVAPPGYHLVGADVDSQEAWIAALLGDAEARMHGGTAFGWMVLQGERKHKTDLHSRTAEILGISRDIAKIFNYGRIYGAGVMSASKLLQQHARMDKDEAKLLAEDLYRQTKGSRMYHLRESGWWNRPEDFQGTKLTRRIEELMQKGDITPDGWMTKTVYDKLLQHLNLTPSTGPPSDMSWRGGTESQAFNCMERIAHMPQPATPFLSCKMSEAMIEANVGHRFLTSRINWVIQSSAVDYLHLMLVSMKYLMHQYGIRGRFCISIHDEARYLIRSEDRYRAALALHITNLYVRAFFCHQVKLYSLPQSVAFFSNVDIDKVLRKEVDMDCITPSQTTPIDHGEKATIEQACELTNGSLSPPGPEPYTPPTFNDAPPFEKPNMHDTLRTKVKTLQLASKMTGRPLPISYERLSKELSDSEGQKGDGISESQPGEPEK